jgi:RimJ/RimL family protein N-acetyltransferase
MKLSFDRPRATERLVLRPLLPGDADALLAYRSLPEVVRYVPFTPMSRAEIERRLAERWRRSAITGEGDGILVGIERGDTGQLIGDISLWLASAEHRCAELGWLLHPDHGGHGFATEGAHGVLHLAFDEPGLDLHRAVARVDARNLKSLALCERLGMRREAVLRENEWFKGEWTDEVDYALLAGEWRAQHAVGGPAACRPR